MFSPVTVGAKHSTLFHFRDDSSYRLPLMNHLGNLAVFLCLILVVQIEHNDVVFSAILTPTGRLELRDNRIAFLCSAACRESQGFPLAFRVFVRHHNLPGLSYAVLYPILWQGRDSNPQPPSYEPGEVPIPLPCVSRETWD